MNDVGTSHTSGRTIQESNVSITATDEENRYRKKLFPESSSVLKSTVRCTACGTSLLKDITKRKDVFFHPVLQVIVCEDCRAFYGDGNFALDSDNSDTYCRWCAQGGSLYCCSACNFVFCKPCIRRNFKKSMLDEIEEEDWKCFVCNPETLWKHRAICWAARIYIKENPGEDDDDDDESSVNERRREKRSVTREKKLHKKGRGAVENGESSKKSKPGKRNTHLTRKIESSDDEDIDHSISNKCSRESADRHKNKESPQPHRSKKNKRKETEDSEDTKDDDGKRHKHRKLKERDKGQDHEKEKGIKQHVSSSKQRETDAGKSDSLAEEESHCAVGQKVTDEEAHQISVMQKTSITMEGLIKDTQVITQSTSKKTKLLYLWISEKNKVSNNQLPTTPAKFTKMIETFTKILQKLSAQTNELQSKVLEAEKEWMDIIRGNEVSDTVSGVDGNQDSKEEELSMSKVDAPEKSELSLKEGDDTMLVNGNTDPPEDIHMRDDTLKNSDFSAINDSVNTSAGNCMSPSSVSLDEPLGSGGAESREVENIENILENAAVGETKKSLSSERKNEAGSNGEDCDEDVENETGNMNKSSLQEKETSPRPETSPSTNAEKICSGKDGENESETEGDKADERQKSKEKCAEGEKSADVGHKEEERTSEIAGETGEKSKGGSEGEVLESNLSVKDSETPIDVAGDGSKASGDSSEKKVVEGEKNDSLFENSVQDLFESDEENNVNVDSVIAQLSSEGETNEIDKNTAVNEDTSARTGIDDAIGGSVNEEKENESEYYERTDETIKPSSDDRQAKMAFLLDTSLSSSEGNESDKLVEVYRSREDKSNLSSSSSDIDSVDSGGGKIKKKAKKSNEKHLYSHLLSLQEDERLKAGCFVSLERLNNHSNQTCNLNKKSKRDSMMKAINRLGNLSSLNKVGNNSSDSDSDDSSSKQKKKKRKVKKKSKSKGSGDNEKDSSDNDDELHDGDTENIDELSKVGTKREVKMMDALAAELLANSSPMDSSSSGSDFVPTKKKANFEAKYIKKKGQVKGKDKNKSDDDNSSSDFDKITSKSSWRRDKLLNEKLSETDSNEEEKKWKAKKEKEKASSRSKLRRCLANSDSDVLVVSSSDKNSDSSDFGTKKKKRKRKASDSSSAKSSESKVKKKKKLRRIKVVDSDSDEGSIKAKNGKDEEEEEKEQTGKGRKNIRKVMKGNQLAEETMAAAKDEEERIKRISERQKMYNELFTDKQNLETLTQVVLDFDPDTKKPLVSVHPKLVKKLKPHQAEGVKFMWEACFESLKRIEDSKGSGCILAHCMGLGKTLQVIALVHTLLNNPKTTVHTVLVICPLNTVLNWVNEFKYWLKDLGSGGDVEVYELSRYKANVERMYQLKDWQNDGGVMVLGYEMYRNLSNTTSKRVRQKFQQVFKSTLVDPGPDLVICDEGHLLKNIASALSKAVNSIRTARRIVLTGTPLQNNLKEYHCMIQFVKPNLLGTHKEFLNRFVNPITNGQLAESTPHDVKVMKRRAHVLHKMLEGCVQRRDYLVLTPFLPPKYEYVICIQLTELQSKLYIHYLQNFVKVGGGTTLFNDFQNLQRIWTHPRLLKIKADIDEKKKLMESDSEGSLREFIDDDTTEPSSYEESSDSGKKKKGKNSSSSGSSSESDVVCINDEDKEEKSKDSKDENKKESEEEPVSTKEWWENYVVPEDYEILEHSGKLVLLLDILQKCELIGDKVLLFSQSLVSLDVIEHFLGVIDDQTQKIGNKHVEDSENSESTPKFIGSWSKGLDYFRIDGSVSAENRSLWCKHFNKPENMRARLFLISTRAGGMGINLVGANRVILFDASWNPSNDLQSIFRIYRFGQNKPCYVYRFLAQGTMEEKIYNRQVTKLSLALRVVDEQQIERHFNLDDLQELYRYEPQVKTKRPTPMLPKDRLLAEVIQKYPDLIDNYHEHDSLLENKTEEELNEEERKAAWEDFENDKKGKLPENNMTMGGIGAFGGMMSQMMYGGDMYSENTLALREAILDMHPNATEEQITTELNLAANRISQYFNNASYPQMQQFYNPSAQQMRPAMSIYPSQGPRFHHQMPLMQAQYGLQNYYHNPVIPSSLTNQARVMPHMVGSTSQHIPQGVRLHQVQPQSIQTNINPPSNNTAGSSVPKLKIRNDLMPPMEDDIIIEGVTRRENQ
ncbi:transcriptional regulator ATRX homolog isoform X2 [Hetaerina americana]|uniref:transcriptional regulator ATRX homolog isoform X2 n=1 Tax=Hetaerina americana TaxID=62018 RepID=UPI003A7F4207